MPQNGSAGWLMLRREDSVNHLMRAAAGTGVQGGRCEPSHVPIARCSLLVGWPRKWGSSRNYSTDLAGRKKDHKLKSKHLSDNFISWRVVSVFSPLSCCRFFVLASTKSRVFEWSAQHSSN